MKGEILPLFIEWLRYKVTLIKITTSSEQDAHTIFVTMNDRGLRLTPTEMLKGYLLSEIKDNNTSNDANKLWQKIMLELKEIEKDGESDFIKYWLRAQYANTIREGKKNSEDKDYEIIGQAFHKWVTDNKSIVGLNNSKSFENFILKKYKLFSNVYISLKRNSMTFNKDFEYVFYNADRDFTLQYQLILATIDLDDTPDIINKKIKLVSCFIDQFIALRVFNFKTVSYSSIKYTVFNITKLIRRKSINELVDIFETYIDDMEYKISGVDNFYLNQFTGRYMLHQSEFATEDDFKHFRDKFGGLLLLSKDKNRSFQAMDFKNKVIKYDSENLLARTLNSNCYKNNPLFLAFAKEKKYNFKSYPEFNKVDLLDRNELYKKLCNDIWNITIFKNLVE